MAQHVAAVLAGAIVGDHASPISDTTVLSALGSGVDLVTHVRTQLPYALSAGAISLVIGYLPALLVTWVGMWVGVAVCRRWAAAGDDSVARALLRGGLAAVCSGLAFCTSEPPNAARNDCKPR